MERRSRRSLSAGCFCHTSTSRSWLMRPSSICASMEQGTMAPSARTAILLVGQPQPVRCPPLEKAGADFSTRLPHASPHAPFRQRTRRSRNAPGIFFLQAQESFHRQSGVRLWSAESHQRSTGRCPGTRRSWCQNGKPRSSSRNLAVSFQVMHIVLVDRHAHGHLHAVPLEGPDPSNRPLKRALPRAGSCDSGLEPSTEIWT